MGKINTCRQAEPWHAYMTEHCSIITGCLKPTNTDISTSTLLIGSVHESGFKRQWVYIHMCRTECEGASKTTYKVRVKYEQSASENIGHSLDV